MFWAKLWSNASHLSENAFLCWTIGQKKIFKTYYRDLCPSINFLVLYCRLLSIIAGEAGGGLFIIRKCPNKCLITFILCLTCWTQIRKKNYFELKFKKKKKKRAVANMGQWHMSCRIYVILQAEWCWPWHVRYNGLGCRGNGLCLTINHNTILCLRKNVNRR